MSKFAKLERAYVKVIVHNLISDQEIVQWPKDEKEISICRSTVTTIRNQAEKDTTYGDVGLRKSDP